MAGWPRGWPALAGARLVRAAGRQGPVAA